MTHSKFRDLIEGRNKDEILIIYTSQASLDRFWSIELGTVRGIFTMLSNMGTMATEELRLRDWLPPLGPYLLRDEVGM